MKQPTRTSAWKLTLIVAVGALACVLGASFLHSAGQSASADHSPAPPCPVGFVDRIADAERVRARLADSPEGATLLDALDRDVRFCFGEIDVPVVSDGQVLVLDSRPDVSEQAARVGHLLHHIVRGMPFPSEIGADAECDEVVEDAIDHEAEAYALEARLRRAFDLTPTRYDFEPDLWAASESERPGLVGRYLREHPNGARNMDGLVAAYAQRCAIERSEASAHE